MPEIDDHEKNVGKMCDGCAHVMCGERFIVRDWHGMGGKCGGMFGCCRCDGYDGCDGCGRYYKCCTCEKIQRSQQ